ncbi:MAG: monooxygenase, partial [Burkholderiaceae bacterium]
GSSLYDHLGPGYTLVRVGQAQASNLQQAAARVGLPLTVLDIPPSDLHRHALYLVRPDQHVAWRGHTDPVDAAGIIHTLTGHAMAA